MKRYLTTYKTVFMKKVGFTLLILLFINLAAIGQTKQKGRIEAEKIAFFSMHMDLTPEEAKIFWPVYNDYTSRKNKIRLDKKALVKYINQNYENLDDKEIEEGGDSIVNYMLEEAELTKKYHEKFKEVLPPAKVVKIYQVEAQFNKILLEQLRNIRSRQDAVNRR